MKLTNKLNLPAPIVEAIANSGYSKGRSDITATGLIEPVRIGALKERHAEELTEDASDLIYSLQGQSIHTILERAAEGLRKDGYIPEARYYVDVAGWTVGAQIDVFHAPTGLLQDYKVTSVYSVKDGVKEEYAQQLNIQAECLRQNGHEVKQLQIVAILRDWSKGEYRRKYQEAHNTAPRERMYKVVGYKWEEDTDEDDNDIQVRVPIKEWLEPPVASLPCDYPEHQVKIIDVPLIPREEVMAFLETRVRAHQASRQSDAVLPLCTAEERWARPTKWAVMEKGKKRATKLHDSQEAAEAHASELKAKVEVRQGQSVRCEQYCPVSRWCSQYKESK